MRPLKRRCSTKEHQFLKITVQEPEVVEEISELWDIGTQKAPNLIWWKVEAVELTDSEKQRVFSAVFQVTARELSILHSCQTLNSLPFQINVNASKNCQKSSEAKTLITPWIFSYKEHDEIDKLFWRTQPCMEKRWQTILLPGIMKEVKPLVSTWLANMLETRHSRPRRDHLLSITHRMASLLPVWTSKVRKIR